VADGALGFVVRRRCVSVGFLGGGVLNVGGHAGAAGVQMPGVEEREGSLGQDHGQEQQPPGDPEA
jgi:hypothetical protein